MADVLAALGAGSLGTLMVRLAADSTSLVKGMNEAHISMSSGSEKMLGQAKNLALGVTGALAAIGTASVVAFAKFDKAMTESLATMGDLSEGTRKHMGDVARSLSGKTIQSADELAKAYSVLGSSGLDATQSMAALPGVAQFATAGIMNLTTGTKMLMDAQSALGLRSKDAAENLANMTRISDVLSKAAVIAKGEIKDFAEALTNKFARGLTDVNKDVEEGVAVLAALAEKGLKGAEASDAMTLAMREMQTAAIGNRKAFADFGVSVFDSHGKMRNFADITGDLETALSGASSETKKESLEMMGFSARSISAMNALIGTSGAIRGYESDLRKAGGATKDISDKMESSLSSQLTMTKNKFNELLLVIGEQLMPFIKDLNVVLAGLAESMKSTGAETSAVTTIMTAISGTLKVVGLGVAVVWTGFQTMATVMATQIQILMTAWDGFTKLFGVWWDAAKGVISGLGQIAKAASGASDVLSALFRRDFAGAKAAAVGMVTGVSAALADISSTVGKAVTESAKIVLETSEEAVGVTGDAITDIKNQWLGLITVHEKVFNPVVEGAKKTETALGGVTKAATTTAKAVTTIVTSFADGVIKAQKLKDIMHAMGVTESPLEKMGLLGKEDDLRKVGVSEDTIGKLGTSRMKLGMGTGIVGPGMGPATQALKQERDDMLKHMDLVKEMNKNEVTIVEAAEKQKLKIRENYAQKVNDLVFAQQQLALSAGESMFGTLASIAEQSAGKQSASYQTMFAMQKAFAIATATLNIKKAISDGFAQGTTIWEKLAAVAIIGAQTASILSSMMSVKLTFAGAKAMGGPVSPGSTFLVGEKGPELFTPSTSGNIIPNHKLGGGGGTQVIVNNYTDVQPRIVEKDDGNKKTIEIMLRRVKQEIGGEIRDGVGTVSSAMEKSFGLRRGKA